MYVDNIKKLHDDLKQIIFVKDEVEAADSDGEGMNLHILIGIIEKFIHSDIWDMYSEQFIMEFGDWEDKDVEEEMIFWPYANTLTDMKKVLRTNYTKLKKIYDKVQQELV